MGIIESTDPPGDLRLVESSESWRMVQDSDSHKRVPPRSPEKGGLLSQGQQCRKKAGGAVTAL
jgi:hypothetical protein